MQALIVDDDPDVSEIMSRCLASWGWEPARSPSISGALELFKERPIDLVLCDVDLPDGNGIALACALLKVRPSLRIIMVSGDRGNLDDARQAGLRRCLRKPFALDELRTLLPSVQASTQERLGP